MGLWGSKKSFALKPVEAPLFPVNSVIPPSAPPSLGRRNKPPLFPPFVLSRCLATLAPGRYVVLA